MGVQKTGEKYESDYPTLGLPQTLNLCEANHQRKNKNKTRHSSWRRARGPKEFPRFGRFSKRSKDFGRLSKFSTKCSQPTLLEGFALRSRKSRSVFRSSDPIGKVIVLLVRGPSSSLTLVRGDITKMAEQDISSVESLFS